MRFLGRYKTYSLAIFYSEVCNYFGIFMFKSEIPLLKSRENIISEIHFVRIELFP